MGRDDPKAAEDIHSISRDELEFFEKIGVLTMVVADGGSEYSELDHARMRLIHKGKSLGFTLGEIAELIVIKEQNAHRSR